MPTAIKRFLAFAAVLILAACAGPQYMNMASSLPPLKPGEGRIFFYAAQPGLGVAGEPKVRLNREVVGRAKGRSFFYVDRPAGSYVVTTKFWTGDGVSFVLNAGETRYVSFSTYTGGSGRSTTLDAVLVTPESEAQRQLLPLRYAGAATH